MSGAPAGRGRSGSAGCPVCGKPAEARYRPFCSRRCADVDLGRWLTGSHVLPGPPLGEEDDPEADAGGNAGGH